MVSSKTQHQSPRNDQEAVALWYAASIIGYPIRVALNLIAPIPGRETIRLIQLCSRSAAMCSLAGFVGIVLLIGASLLIGLLGMIGTDLQITADFKVLPIWITSLAFIFGGMVALTGLDGYLKNCPSGQPDEEPNG